MSCIFTQSVKHDVLWYKVGIYVPFCGFFNEIQPIRFRYGARGKVKARDFTLTFIHARVSQFLLSTLRCDCTQC